MNAKLWSGLLVVILAAAGPLMADWEIPAEYRQLQAIIDDATLTKEQKVRRIGEHLGPDRLPDAVQWIFRVDRATARQTARTAFGNPQTSREQKLQLGKLMLTRLEEPGFIDMYAPFLVDAVLNGGQDEFMQKRIEHRISAVGEYAFIASDFDGMSSALFPKLADKRVIPVLINCLDAPDHVWPKEQGDVIRGKPKGKPGESTGRNTQRQQIPVALTKLGATEAIPALKRVLADHHDWYERFNSAYALGALMEPAASHALLQALKAREDEKDNRLMLFGLGRGLLQRSDDAGLELMSFRYSTYLNKDEVNAVLYMLEERLPAVTQSKSPACEAFYKEALDCPPLRTLLLFDASGVKVPAWYTPNNATPEQILMSARDRIRKDYQQMTTHMVALKLKDLAPALEAIGSKSADPEVQRLSREAVQALQN